MYGALGVLGRDGGGRFDVGGSFEAGKVEGERDVLLSCARYGHLEVGGEGTTAEPLKAVVVEGELSTLGLVGALYLKAMNGLVGGVGKEAIGEAWRVGGL